MKHNLVYTDNQTALQAISPSAGLPMSRKKKIANRFPSSSRVHGDYQKPKERLPQIVSPKNASTGTNHFELKT